MTGFRPPPGGPIAHTKFTSTRLRNSPVTDTGRYKNSDNALVSVLCRPPGILCANRLVFCEATNSIIAIFAIQPNESHFLSSKP